MYNRVYGKEGALIGLTLNLRLWGGDGWWRLRVVIHSLGIYWGAIQNDD